jgi:capsular exopolysaccharide synthesis family protein
MTGKKKSSIIETDDIVQVWKIFSKNWYIIVIALIIAYLSSWLYIHKINQVYAAQSQVLLKNDETYDYQNQIYKGLGYYGYSSANSNQIRVLTSNDLIEETLSRLNFEVSYFIVGRLKTTEVYNAMPFDVDIQLQDYSLFERDFGCKILNENEYELSYIKDEKKISRKYPFNKLVHTADFQLTISRTALLNPQTVKKLTEIDYNFRVHDLSSLIARYKSAISVENLENTTILQLTVEDAIPARAITFLDTLSRVYIDYTAQNQLLINENTLNNIDKQLKEVIEILTGIEDDMQLYRAEKSVLNLPRQEDDYFNKLLEYDSKRRTFELQIQSLEALEKYIIAVEGSSDQKLLPPSFYISPDDYYLKSALERLYSMQMQRNERLFGITESNRGIGELDQNIELLRKNLLTYIVNSKKGLESKISDVEKMIGEYTGIIKTVPKTERELLAIQRKLNVNEKMYVYLLEKRANTIIARAGILPETSVIETAHSIGLVKPNKTKVTYYFLTVGFLIAMIVIFIRVLVFATIQSVQELKAITNLPVLGEIVRTKTEGSGYIVVDKDPKSPITESFRVLRTNLEYMATHSRKGNVVLITSYNPGEGKTFCSVNLGAILAKAGKRVLLIELDLHKPKVQRALNMTSDVGVSSILIGKSTVESAVLNAGIDNLYAILSGPTPPNASEIILSPHMEEIFAYGRDNFDYVIVDTPPIGLITDALVIMKHCDVNLFVLNTKVASKKIINITEEIVATNKLQGFGFILNGVKRNKSRYYYNYGYGYTYGYGYGSSESGKKGNN